MSALCFCVIQVCNVDDVLAYHSDFLNNCLKDCMLTNPQLLKIVHKLMMVCVTFSNFIQVCQLLLLGRITAQIAAWETSLFMTHQGL